MTTKLYYFDGRGKAELIRIILSVTGVQFEEFDFTEKAQWEEMKKGGKLLYNQVPLLEIDGMNLVQTGAIVRHLARKFNMYGKDDKEATLIDMYFEGTRDFYNNGFVAVVFKDEAEVLKNTKDVVMPKYMPAYEGILKSSNGKYLTGNTMSVADLALLECLLSVEDYFGMGAFDSYPKLKEFYVGLKAEDRVAAFLSGPHRKGKNDQKYVANVRKILYE